MEHDSVYYDEEYKTVGKWFLKNEERDSFRIDYLPFPVLLASRVIWGVSALKLFGWIISLEEIRKTGDAQKKSTETIGSRVCAIALPPRVDS